MTRCKTITSMSAVFSSGTEALWKKGQTRTRELCLPHHHEVAKKQPFVIRQMVQSLTGSMASHCNDACWWLFNNPTNAFDELQRDT